MVVIKLFLSVVLSLVICNSVKSEQQATSLNPIFSEMSLSTVKDPDRNIDLRSKNFVDIIVQYDGDDPNTIVPQCEVTLYLLNNVIKIRKFEVDSNFYIKINTVQTSQGSREFSKLSGVFVDWDSSTDDLPDWLESHLDVGSNVAGQLCEAILQMVWALENGFDILVMASWSTWGPWGPCDVKCGDKGHRTRTRHCIAMEYSWCKGSNKQQKACVRDCSWKQNSSYPNTHFPKENGPMFPTDVSSHNLDVKIGYKSEPVVVAEGSTSSLHCVIASDPSQSVVWNSPDGDIIWGEKYKIDGGVLTILHTKVTDSGTYTCTRTDAGGETHRATAQLVVRSCRIDNPCVNGGVCSEMFYSEGHKSKHHVCQCPQGYRGEYCEIQDKLQGSFAGWKITLICLSVFIIFGCTSAFICGCTDSHLKKKWKKNQNEYHNPPGSKSSDSNTTDLIDFSHMGKTKDSRVDSLGYLVPLQRSSLLTQKNEKTGKKTIRLPRIGKKRSNVSPRKVPKRKSNSLIARIKRLIPGMHFKWNKRDVLEKRLEYEVFPLYVKSQHEMPLNINKGPSLLKDESDIESEGNIDEASPVAQRSSLALPQSEEVDVIVEPYQNKSRILSVLTKPKQDISVSCDVPCGTVIQHDTMLENANKPMDPNSEKQKLDEEKRFQEHLPKNIVTTEKMFNKTVKLSDHSPKYIEKAIQNEDNSLKVQNTCFLSDSEQVQDMDEPGSTQNVSYHSDGETTPWKTNAVQHLSVPTPTKKSVPFSNCSVVSAISGNSDTVWHSITDLPPPSPRVIDEPLAGTETEDKETTQQDKTTVWKLMQNLATRNMWINSKESKEDVNENNNQQSWHQDSISNEINFELQRLGLNSNVSDGVLTDNCITSKHCIDVVDTKGDKSPSNIEEDSFVERKHNYQKPPEMYKSHIRASEGSNLEVTDFTAKECTASNTVREITTEKETINNLATREMNTTNSCSTAYPYITESVNEKYRIHAFPDQNPLIRRQNDTPTLRSIKREHSYSHPADLYESQNTSDDSINTENIAFTCKKSTGRNASFDIPSEEEAIPDIFVTTDSSTRNSCITDGDTHLFTTEHKSEKHFKKSNQGTSKPCTTDNRESDMESEKNSCTPADKRFDNSTATLSYNTCTESGSCVQGIDVGGNVVQNCDSRMTKIVNNVSEGHEGTEEAIEDSSDTSLVQLNVLFSQLENNIKDALSHAKN